MKKKITIFAILLMILTVSTSFGSDRPSDKDGNLRKLMENKDEEISPAERKKLLQRELDIIALKEKIAGNYGDQPTVSVGLTKGTQEILNFGLRESAAWRQEIGRMARMGGSGALLVAGLYALIKGSTTLDKNKGGKGKHVRDVGAILTMIGFIALYFFSRDTGPAKIPPNHPAT